MALMVLSLMELITLTIQVVRSVMQEMSMVMGLTISLLGQAMQILMIILVQEKVMLSLAQVVDLMPVSN